MAGWRRICVALAGAAAMIGADSMAAPPRVRPARSHAMPVDPKLFDGNPPHHIGEYPGFKIAWEADPRVRDVTGVFPHPLLTPRIVLATGAGLVISDDGGKNWNDLPGTAPAAIGPVRHVEFALLSNDLY